MITKITDADAQFSERADFGVANYRCYAGVFFHQPFQDRHLVVAINIQPMFFGERGGPGPAISDAPAIAFRYPDADAVENPLFSFSNRSRQTLVLDDLALSNLMCDPGGADCSYAAAHVIG